MAIASPKPYMNRNVVQEVATTNRTTLVENYIDHNVTPIQSLLPQLAGTDWNVDYYHALVGAHTDLEQLDVSTSATHQSYELIKSLPIKLTGSLSHSYNETNTISEVTGTATITFGIVPNKGDVFKATAGTYTSALFQVRNVERMSYNRASVYNITFTLISVDEQTKPLLIVLNSRIVRTYHHDKERAYDGLSSILVEDEYKHRIEIARLNELLGRTYLERFYVHGIDTLLLPGQSVRIYDDAIVKFALHFIKGNQVKHFSGIDLPNISRELTKDINLFSILLNRDEYGFALCSYEKGLLLTKNIRPNTALFSPLGHLTFLNLDYVLVEKNLRPYNQDTDLRGRGDIDLDTNTKVNGFDYLTAKTIVVEGQSIPLYPTLSLFDSYILPLNFYLTKQPSSSLERQLLRAIRREALHPEELHMLLKHLYELSPLEQFYFYPLIAYLATVYLRT